jgi:hypothetical protein
MIIINIIMVTNVIFSLMLCLYVDTIYIVCNFYNASNQSISSIIQNEDCNKLIFTNMIYMSGFTVIYEIYRNDVISLFSIFFLLLGIYGVIIYDHTKYIHYVFGFIVFMSIFIFMYNHSYKTGFLSFLFDFFIFISFGFFAFELLYVEIFLLFIFAIFYISLHFLGESPQNEIPCMTATSEYI